MPSTRGFWPLATLALSLVAVALPAAEALRIATYNLENYLEEPVGTRPGKSEAAKAKIREGLRALNPDVVALQEVGGQAALQELRQSLKAEGLDFPYSELARGFDTNIFVGVLSKYPLVATRSHTNLNYLLGGSRLQVSRGFAEVDVEVPGGYRFTLLSAHLKSRRPVPTADEGEMRVEEAKLLREIIDAHLAAHPNANLVVLGDFNDTYDSPAVKTVIGTGRNKLVDTRPAEANGDNQPNPIPRFNPRNITWTHFYGKEDSYSRIDYILLSPGMAREWRPQDSRVLTLTNWGVGSDHRPIMVTLTPEDK
jgi:endonuclease/exonuclease/phosphatase family metal-dependent hydrolase